MKIVFEAVKQLVFDGYAVHIGSETLGTYYIISYEKRRNKGPIQVEYTLKEDDDGTPHITEWFHTFRKGDATFRCLENFLTLWSETVNADDCQLYFLEKNNGEITPSA